MKFLDETLHTYVHVRSKSSGKHGLCLVHAEHHTVGSVLIAKSINCELLAFFNFRFTKLNL